MIQRIPGPTDVPSDIAQWDKINDVQQLLYLMTGRTVRFTGSTVPRGAAFNIGGDWFLATSDTAITGTASDYVLITPSGDTATAAFSANPTITWSPVYNGWYTTSGALCVFDEVRALAAGKINKIYTSQAWNPSSNWCKGLSRVLSNANLAKLFHPDAAQTLTGSGTYTVGAGVYQITVTLVGPGENGADGYVSTPGDGGASGEEITVTIGVTPGQEISYSVTGTSTVFGSTTAAKGAGTLGQKSGSGVPFGGNGGGYKAGEGGGASSNGGNATANYGGGGGGGGSPTSGSTTGGTGATGRIEIT